jgi:hypothetical protein
MTNRRALRVTAGLVCLALSAWAGWVWHAYSDNEYEARARLTGAIDLISDDSSDDEDEALSSTEELVLAPEVLSTAAGLLHDRNVPLSLASPFDSETDYLLNRTHVTRPVERGADEIQITCTATGGDEARQMLTAVIDAFIESRRAARGTAGGAASMESGAEQRQLARAIDRQERMVNELVSQLRNADDTGVADSGTDTAEKAAAEGRQRVAETERRLDAAQQDFEQKVPADTVAASLPEGPVRTAILNRLTLIRLCDELHHEEMQLEKSAAVYGRNHPRMAEIRERIEQLQQKILRFPRATAEGAQGPADSSPVLIVLDALESDLADVEGAQQELEQQLAAACDRLTVQQEMEAKLTEARQELAFLRGEDDRFRQQAEDARREDERRFPVVVDEPALAPAPVAPRAGLQIAVSCLAGMALYLVLLRQLRPRSHADAPVEHEPLRSSQRPRFFSQEEQQLVRLKMLSASR